MSKGSGRRPAQIDRATYEAAWDRTFGKKEIVVPSGRTWAGEPYYCEPKDVVPVTAEEIMRDIPDLRT